MNSSWQKQLQILQMQQLPIHHQQRASEIAADAINIPAATVATMDDDTSTSDKSDSVLQSSDHEHEPDDSNIPTNTMQILEREDLEANQRGDPEWGVMIRYLENQELPENNVMARKIVFSSEQYCMMEGKLFHLHNPRSQKIGIAYPILKQLCIPECMKNEILQHFHHNYQHIGEQRLFHTIRQRYFWTTMYKDCHITATDCLLCQETKDHGRKKAPMHSLEASETNMVLHFDIFGPLPTSPAPHNFRYVLTVIDAFSRYVELFPLRTLKSTEVAQKLVSYIARWGIPRTIISDAAANLTGEVMTQLANIFPDQAIENLDFRSKSERKSGSSQ